MKMFTTLCALILLVTGSVGRAAYGTQLASYSFGTSCIARDDHRDRIYCTIPTQNSVAIIDSQSLQVVATVFTGSQPAWLDVSPDGTKLFVAHQGTTSQGIAVLNLDTLAVDHYISTTAAPTSVAAGTSAVYTVEAGYLRAYDIASGVAIPGNWNTYSGGVSVYSGTLRTSLDRKTLYYHDAGISPSHWYRINVNVWPGTLLQQGSDGSNGQDMCLSADGQYITFVSGAPYSINKCLASNPATSLGTMNTGPYPRVVTYSPDGNYIYSVHTSGTIDVWNANTFVALPSITTVGQPSSMQSERLGKVLFAGTSTTLKAYYTGNSSSSTPINVTINQAVEIRWDSVAGSLYQVEWKSKLSSDSTWYSLGGQIVGNGLTMSVFDTTRNSQGKFFRVTQISQ